VATLTLGFILREELEAIEWIFEEVKSRNSLHLLETESIVRSLLVAIHADDHLHIPLLHLDRMERYPATHALNVATLSMALGEAIGMGFDEVHGLGMAALLHDVGMVRVPEETLNRTGELSERERTVLNSHTIEGARIILESDRRLDVAAAVAYEHHLRMDGGGYPRLIHPRACHPCSRLVQICDVYDALRSGRPHREGWNHESALDHIRSGGGTNFDGEIGEAFATMMEQGEHRMAILRNEDEPLPIRDSSAGERFQEIVQQQTDESAGEGAGDNGRKEGGS
jgi:putative nucleotidyltransferase with HDIG domain